MAKSRWREDQAVPMDGYMVKITARHAREARKLGAGSLAEGIRLAIEKAVDSQLERRYGAADRRVKKK